MKPYFFRLLKHTNTQQVLCYLLLGVAFLPLYRYQINSDGISYLAIADHYLQGNFAQALNGYWSPLFSWLLIPFLSVGIAPLLSAKLLNLTIGAICLRLYQKIARPLIQDVRVYQILGFAIAPLLVWYSLYVITPDLLSVCLLLCYLQALLPYLQAPSLTRVVPVGVVASIGYLAKAYLFPFFLLHFFCIHLWTAVTSDANKRRLLTGYLIGMGIFFLLSLPWLYLIGEKYQGAGFSTAASYNHGLFSPERQGLHLYLDGGLYPPPHSSATSVWEDPSTLSLEDWSPFQSQQHLQWQLQLFVNNLQVFFKKLEARSLFPFVLLFSIWYFLRPKAQRQMNTERLILSFFLYPSGYFLLVLEHRYIQLNYLLGYLFLALAIQALSLKLKAWKKQLLLFCFGIYLCLLPFARLVSSIHIGREQYQESVELAERFDLQAKRLASALDWDLFIAYAYQTGATYFGIPKATQVEEGLNVELQKYKVDYYFSAIDAPVTLESYVLIDTVFDRYLVYQRASIAPSR